MEMSPSLYGYYSRPTFRLCVEVKPILYKRWFSISWSCLLSIVQDRDGQLGGLIGAVWSDHPEHGCVFLSGVFILAWLPHGLPLFLEWRHQKEGLKSLG